MEPIQHFLQKKFHTCNRIVVLGVGSELCHDDGVGGYFVSLLQEHFCDDRFLFLDGAAAPENFTGEIKRFHPDLLIVVDAAFLDLPPGSIEILPSNSAAGLSFSTHMLPLPVVLKYLEQETGCESLLIGVQAATTEQGFGLSAPVRQGAQLLLSLFSAALEAKDCSPT